MRALLKKELGLVEELGGDLQLLCLGPWKAYGNSEVVGIFQYLLDADVWCGHMYIAPSARGKYGIDCLAKTLDLFFADTGCSEVLGFTPTDRKGALVVARALGFKPIKKTNEIIVSELLKEDFKYGC